MNIQGQTHPWSGQRIKAVFFTWAQGLFVLRLQPSTEPCPWPLAWIRRIPVGIPGKPTYSRHAKAVPGIWAPCQECQALGHLNIRDKSSATQPNWRIGEGLWRVWTSCSKFKMTTQQPLNRKKIIKTTGQHINLTADFFPTRQPNASCFIFLPTRIFKNNFRQPHKWHIWFCPIHKPKLRKTKRAIFIQGAKKILGILKLYLPTQKPIIN